MKKNYEPAERVVRIRSGVYTGITVAKVQKRRFLPGYKLVK